MAQIIIQTINGLVNGMVLAMVASGLTQRVEVSQYRLATHLILALVIFAAIVWTLLRRADRPRAVASSRLKLTGAGGP